MKSVDNQLALADSASRYEKDRPAKADDIVFVHCCCEKGNLLSKPVERQGLKANILHKSTTSHIPKR